MTILLLYLGLVVAVLLTIVRVAVAEEPWLIAWIWLVFGLASLSMMAYSFSCLPWPV